MKRRGAAIVIGAALALGTLPFAVTGWWARQAMDSLAPALAGSSIPLRAEATLREAGLFRSRFGHRLLIATPAGAVAVLVDSRVRHGLLGAQIESQLRLDDGTGAPAAPGGGFARAETMVRLRPFLRGHWSARAVLELRPVDIAPGPGRPGVSSAAARFEIAARAGHVAIDGAMDAITIVTADRRSSRWSAPRLLFHTRIPAERGEYAPILRLTAERAEVVSPPLLLTIEAPALNLALEPASEGLALRADLVAGELVSRGLPFVRLDGPSLSVSGQLRDEPHPALTDLRAALRSGSGYGDLEADFAVNVLRPGAWPPPLSFSAELPRALARLILGSNPARAEAWRNDGILVERGERAIIAGRWSLEGLRPAD